MLGVNCNSVVDGLIHLNRKEGSMKRIKEDNQKQKVNNINKNSMVTLTG